MVIEIDICRFAPIAVPSENESPLLVDADRMKISQLAAQLFEMIARRYAQVLIGAGIVDHLQSTKQPAFQIGWNVSRSHVIHKKSRATNRPEN
jgi:hypothetical protein